MYILVLSTCGSRKEAEKIALDLLDRRLVACVNVMPIRSFYRWKGKVRVDREYLILAKTRSKFFAELKKRILAIHSYELPEIVWFRIEGGHGKYLDWIGAEVGG